MPNTAKKPGKSDIKTFIKAASSKQVAQFLDILNIRDEASHRQAVDLVGDLMDVTGDDPENPLYRVIDVLGDAIAHYEEKIYPIPTLSPVDVVKHLMEANDLKQNDMSEVFGSQSIASEVLSGKRELNLKHIRKLAERFRVNPAVFI